MSPLTAFIVGLSPYLIHRLERRLAPSSEEPGPLGSVWAKVEGSKWYRWAWTRQFKARRAVTGTLRPLLTVGWVPGVKALLSTRHVTVIWRVQSHYWGMGTPESPGGFRYIAGTADYWTRAGADFSRRYGHRVRPIGMSASRWTQVVDNREPVKPWPDSPEVMVSELSRVSEHG